MAHDWIVTQQNKNLRHLLRRGLFLVFAALLLAVAQFGFNSASAQKAQKTQRSQRAAVKRRIPGNDFIFGINLPWFDGQYGHDLGPDPQHQDWKVWYDGSKVSGYFADINKIGLRVVRIWLMEHAEGLVMDQSGLIVGLDEKFLENLDDLVRLARDENLRLYLCLTTTWCDVKYESPVRSQRQQTAYLKQAVRPLARRLKGNKTVFAFDVFNEIESEVLGKHAQITTLANLQSFVRNSVSAIKAEDPHRLVSAGSGWGDWKYVKEGRYRNLGLDFYDIHVYRDDGYLPDLRELNVDKPVIVGECGQRTEREDDEMQRRAVTSFLRNAVEKGYAGCFPWEYGPKGKHLKILRENGEHKPVVADIQNIIKSHRR